MISTICRLKNSKVVDPRVQQIVENLNCRLLETVIEIFNKKDEYEFIFARLKKEFRSEKNSS